MVVIVVLTNSSRPASTGLSPDTQTTPTKQAPRFSRGQLLLWVTRKRAAMQEEFGFDPNNGYAQVDGRGEEINRAYGMYDMLDAIADEFWPKGRAL